MGVQITNAASIVFDFNGSISTRTVTNAIDATAPMSSISALPSEVLPLFNVTWLGQDETNGSGVASFTIYVSEDGSAFIEWLTTTSTSALFNGAYGHSYRFYSVARDNVGNVETAPALSEAMTMVVSNPLRLVNFE